MKKIKNKTGLKTEGIFDTGKSSASIVSEEDNYQGFIELEPVGVNNTPEEKNNDNSRMFFLNAMNQYESALNREFRD